MMKDWAICITILPGPPIEMNIEHSLNQRNGVELDSFVKQYLQFEEMTLGSWLMQITALFVIVSPSTWNLLTQIHPDSVKILSNRNCII